MPTATPLFPFAAPLSSYEEFMYRFDRRHMGTGVADRLLIACVTGQPHPNAV